MKTCWLTYKITQPMRKKKYSVKQNLTTKNYWNTMFKITNYLILNLYVNSLYPLKENFEINELS